MQGAGRTFPSTSDRECLESWSRHRDGESLQTLVERYLVFVHSSALRRTGDAAHPSPGEWPDTFNRPAHEFKRFIDKRAESVRGQLDGKSKGMILKYPKEK